MTLSRTNVFILLVFFMTEFGIARLDGLGYLLSFGTALLCTLIVPLLVWIYSK